MAKLIDENYQVRVQRHPDTGKLVQEFWQNANGYYCPHGPAITRWDQDTSNIIEKVWFNKKGETHRDGDKPAMICINPYTNIVTCEVYYINGEVHRLLEGAPTRIDRNPVTGQIEYQEWQVHGEMHRENGLPAAIRIIPETGIVVLEGYYCQGELIKEIERDPITGLEPSIPQNNDSQLSNKLKM